ncbi:hypothetical protein KVC40_03270 [Helicobacter pylori]|nr:hypothetical protein KVC40_03270 [Helicobacter pylori]
MKGTIKTLSRFCHSDGNIKAKKRLYMTATPKVYSESSKVKAKESDNAIYSMDDEEVFLAKKSIRSILKERSL